MPGFAEDYFPWAIRRMGSFVLALFTVMLGSCTPAPVERKEPANAFHTELKQSLQREPLSACAVTITSERVSTDGAVREVKHVKVIAPDRALLEQVEGTVQRTAADHGLSFRRWAAPPEETGFVLYEISEGRRRVSSILIMPRSEVGAGTAPTLPPDEPEPSKIILPRIFHGDYKVSIIIDDLGADLAVAEELSKLRQNVTFSIIPELKYSRETAELAKASGKEVMIHLPMEPEAHEGLVIEPKTILAAMSPTEIESTFNELVAGVPFAVGINNHMGSKVTPNRALMSEVLALTKLHGLFFIDSRTTPATQAYTIAREMGVPTNFRSVFLDDKKEVSYTEYELDVLLKRMLKQGSAIAIGHPFPSTVEALRRKLPELERRGVKIVFASELVI